MKKLFKGIGIAFILLIALGIIGTIAGGNDSDQTSASPANVEQTKSPVTAEESKPKEPVQTEKAAEPAKPAKPSIKTYKEGMYKVGTDIPAGEYVLISDSFMSYFDVSKDSTGKLDSILANDNFSSRSIISVKNGQYLKLQDCIAYPFKDAPKAELIDGCLPAGMYKVGIDLPAGEYKVIPEGMAYIEVSSNSSHNLGAIVSNDNIQGESYITVKNGQYLKLNDAKLKVK